MDKLIDQIFRCYIKQAQGASFVPCENVEIDWAQIKTYGDAQILTQSLMEQQVWFTPRLINALEAKGVSIDKAVKQGIADVPTELENRLICLEIAKRFDLSLCPQFQDGLLQIEKRKDYLMPVKKDGLIVGIRFEYLPSKKALQQAAR